MLAFNQSTRSIFSLSYSALIQFPFLPSKLLFLTRKFSFPSSFYRFFKQQAKFKLQTAYFYIYFAQIYNQRVYKQNRLLFNINMNDCDSFLTSVSQSSKNPQSKQVKFISPTKWQKYIIDTLKTMATKYSNKKNLITDLITIVSSVPQTHFVEATLKIRPFKPQFYETIPTLTSVTQSTLAETIIRNIRFEKCESKIKIQTQKRHKITEKTLAQQFDKDYHPFKFIIRNFQRLLQLKFKSLIDSKKISKIENLCLELKSDMQIFSQIIHKASQPYKKLFKSTIIQGTEQDNKKFDQFIDSFMFDHQKLNKCLHKIILYGVRAIFKQKMQQKLPDQADPQNFQIPQQFKIQGGYIRSINSLIQFGELTHHQKCLKKLLQVRENILIDINEYYSGKNMNKQLEVSAEVQIQIIRYCIAKLKVWACELYAQLKFLEYVYGEQQIAYKYEQSSYMYTQLSMAFEILELQSNSQ